MEYLNEALLEDIASKQNIKVSQIKVVLDFLKDNCTVPFIARYRKEATGALDEDQIRAISEAYEYGVNLQKRKDDVKRLIAEKGMLTDELSQKIDEAMKLVEVDDLYRPYKEKKKTKATEAIALGLEPLADEIMKFYRRGTKEEVLNKYLTDKVKTVEEALTGAKYIIAERISDNAEYRKDLRERWGKYSVLSTKKKKDALDEEELYKNYYEFQANINHLKGYQVLAINRAVNEGIINASIANDKNKDLEYLEYKVIHFRESIFLDDIKDAIADSYKRLIAPALEREIKAMILDNASDGAIEVFAMNLKNLLLQSPMKGHIVLGVDPAFRTGCKLAVVSKTGKVLEIGVIYPNEKAKGASVDERLVLKSKKTIVDLYKKYHFGLIAIGNGTASRETESFIAEVIKENNLDAKYVIVSEAGASVYSASPIAQEEFPDFEVQERSAVSIARRLQDPLAELVKIDPKSIGVGQYQHDVSEAKLSNSLDFVVTEAVNRVGVNVNTASASLLSYVSGLNKKVSKNIITYRDEVKGIKNRKELKNVSGLGPKAYEQSVGFLRVLEGDEPLDKTPIHPESYDKAQLVLKELGLSSNDLGTKEMKEKVLNANKQELKNKLGIDEYTLNDILDAFVAPMRDVRESYQAPKLRSDILHFEDLKIGDELEGTVRNVCDFGAFVDCGVKYDGLVHLSKMSTKYIKNPSEVVKVGDLVKVYVIDIDYNRHKLALSMIKNN